MNKLFKTLAKCKLVILALSMALVVGACTKDDNPFNIGEADASEYGGTANDGVIKILAIGNSFSENALESNLYELAKESGKTVIIGNMYIGGASLADHKKNIENNAAIYSYRKIGKDGVKKTFNNIRIDWAVEDEHWDYISFQQASPNSGQLETVQASLPAVFNYVKARAKNPNVKYIYHQTWAYAKSSTHDGFANYNKDQLTMYNAIVNVSKNVKSIVPIDIIVPAGTAIQDGRTSAQEDGFTSDGYHLNAVGKYTAACTWFETIFGQSAVGMKYKPSDITTDFPIRVAQNAAHFAVLKPFEITEMVDFQGEGGPLASPVLIDFGTSEATKSESWNQVSDFTAGTRVNLKDSQGKEYIGLALTITERFTGINTNGATGTTTSMNMPDNVSKYNFYGNAKAVFAGVQTPQSTFTISGLDKSLTYNFCFFGSRSSGGNRETVYTVAGTNSGSSSLNAASNATAIACVSSIKPSANGKITVSVTSGPNNDTSQGFFYLNAAKITSN